MTGKLLTLVVSAAAGLRRHVVYIYNESGFLTGRRAWHRIGGRWIDFIGRHDMSTPSSARSGPVFRLILATVVWSASYAAAAQHQTLDNAQVVSLAVNGGVDTANPGTSCIQLAPAPVTACTGGWVALPNNNRQLLASVLTAKASANRVWLYYVDNSYQHCPGLAFTPCSAISVILK